MMLIHAGLAAQTSHPPPPAHRPLSTQDTAALHAALDSYDRGNLTTAEPALQAILRKHPQNYEANEALGSLYAETGNPTAALPYLRQACRIAPREALPHANLGATYLTLGLHADAVTQLTSAARLDPSNATTQSSLGEALMSAHHPKDAAAAYSQASQLVPSDATTKYNWALALFQSGSAKQASDVLDSIPAASMSEQAHSLAGDADEQAGRFERALLHFQAAANLDPTDSNLYALTGELLRHWTWPEAIKVANYGSTRFPESTHFRMAAGIAYYANNQYTEAINLFSGLLQSSPDDAAVADLLGRSCSLLVDGENTECAAMYNFAERHPGNPIITTYAAVSLLHQTAEKQDLGKAASLLQSALQADPNFAEAYLQMGILEQARMQWKQSAAYLEKAISLRPASAESHYRLSRAYAHLGRRDEAQAQVALHQKYSKESKEALDTRMQEVIKFVLSPS